MMIGYALLQIRLRCPHCRHVDSVAKIGVRVGQRRTCGRCKRDYEIAVVRLVDPTSR